MMISISEVGDYVKISNGEYYFHVFRSIYSLDKDVVMRNAETIIRFLRRVGMKGTVYMTAGVTECDVHVIIDNTYSRLRLVLTPYEIIVEVVNEKRTIDGIIETVLHKWRMHYTNSPEKISNILETAEAIFNEVGKNTEKEE